MSLFEHENHRLAGRALVIVSSMTIILQQCTRPFSEIALLGFQTQINSQDMSAIMTGLVMVYGFIFVFRAYQSDVVFSYLLIDEETEDRRNTVSAPILGWLQEERGALRNKIEAVQSHGNNRQAIEVLEAQRDEIGRLQLKKQNRFLLQYRIRGWAEYVFRVVLEVFVPLIFAVVALFVPVGASICGAYTAEILMHSLVP